MSNNYILIFINCVTISRNSNAYYSAWTAELTNYLSGIVKENDFKIITISKAPNPTYLVARNTTKELFSGQREESTHDSANPSFSEHPNECQYKWQVGRGFTRSYSKFCMKFSEVSDENNFSRFNFLIEKYLEFLKRFNTAYDDDLYLNLSFVHPSSTYEHIIL